ncbi:hypothetical protein [Thalassobius sp. I31.1]|uniref:hypothetical protein n=1 Tax=Thalassobius sp. I31.1 TaxID=2109912 RepID=UPI000D1B836D|nr:hypothetical protein [Thalassobius sp. I31.1]
MEKFPQSFEVYGFTIEVHAGGRRVWPPSFKRFITNSLDDGSLKVDDVMKRCNVSQSLVYKWRADLKRAGGNRISVREERLFSEVVIEDTERSEATGSVETQIVLRGREIEIVLPAEYPIDNLVTVVLSLEGRA